MTIAAPYTAGSGRWPGVAEVMTEAGGTLRALSDIMAADEASPAPAARLEMAVAKLLAAVGYLADCNGLDAATIAERAAEERARLEECHRRAAA